MDLSVVRAKVLDSAQLVTARENALQFSFLYFLKHKINQTGGGGLLHSQIFTMAEEQHQSQWLYLL